MLINTMKLTVLNELRNVTLICSTLKSLNKLHCSAGKSLDCQLWFWELMTDFKWWPCDLKHCFLNVNYLCIWGSWCFAATLVLGSADVSPFLHHIHFVLQLLLAKSFSLSGMYCVILQLSVFSITINHFTEEVIHYFARVNFSSEMRKTDMVQKGTSQC